MSLRAVADAIWMTRASALAQGFTHEGWHFGVPVFCQYDERDEEAMGMVVAKSWFLEWVITAGAGMLHLANSFREPGDEIWFGFCIRPIPTEATP